MNSRLSIATRLTAIFAIVATGVLTVLGIAIYLSARHNLIAQDFAELENKVALISELVSAGTHEQRAQRLAEALGHHPNIEFHIIDDRGEQLFSTASEELRIHAQNQPADPNVRRRDWTLIGGPRLHVIHLRQRVADGSTVTILLGIDDARHAAFLRRFRHLLAIAIVTAALASSLLGGYAVRRTLRPLQTLSHEARQITAGRLQSRLSVDAAPAELEQLAQALNGMLARLQQDFTRLTEFSGDLAHELRTPITNMLTQVQVVLTHPRSNDAYRETLASCAEELQQLAEIVSDLLYLAQAEAPGALPTCELVPLDEVVDSLFDFYELLAEDRQLQLRRQGSAHVEGNRLMLHRAIANLLSNALRHATEGTDVVVGISESRGMCRIAVCNQGKPIVSDDISRLFDRFYREDGRSEGAGLGLAITRAIVQAHGGSITVDSSERGTTFELLIPACATAA
ncbi:heavy metal sensor histidine kinase [Stenotrophomonas sp. SY1]|uniref:heavy metal sensor histidine kinase n=1 Tax=Stenotrophomonas sp. SY1 TaxID=477235 RepID=UPI001E58D801|nr:heavy metal sensor histidine kinase [Stenotrophomonas sp. SY1]MCD9087376.1 heavy metal sensor histidine kinase [Stenotrophomonas sp. SY1]